MSAGERKGENQKQKMLYLTKIFHEETDDQNGLTMPQIIKLLAQNGVNADRKTLYLDFEELRAFGLDIIAEKKGRECYYHLGQREFELPELKLLVDSVQSARFITDSKSESLIRKLEGLAGKHQARQLQRQVVISGRIKTMNNSIYINVDKIHEAINADCQISFKYFQWNIKKETEYRRGGKLYQVSPWCLMWDNENYYLVAYDAEDGIIKHYRVDKMKQIDTVQEQRLGRESFKAFDAPRYSNALFGMFGGEESSVVIEADNSKVGILIDRFGKDIPITELEGGRFRTVVNAAVSDQFLGWIISLGDGIRLTGPENVVSRMREIAGRLTSQYAE